MAATSVIPASIQRPSPSDHRVGFSTSFTRLLMGSLALRPALLLFGNSRPRVTTTPLPHATGAYGQLPGRDFNPLDLLLLLRTVRVIDFDLPKSMTLTPLIQRRHQAVPGICTCLDSHGCEECRFCRTQKPAPEAARTSIFAIGASSDRFVEAAHKPGKAAQPLPTDVQSFGVSEQVLLLDLASNMVDLTIDSCRKQSDPTRRNVFG